MNDHLPVAERQSFDQSEEQISPFAGEELGLGR